MTSISDTEVVNAPGGLVELGYAERTSNITSISTNASSPTTVAEVTIVSDGSPLLVDFFASHARPNQAAGSSINLSLWVDGSEYTRYWTYTETPSTASLWAPIRATRRITLSAGLHTIRAVVWCNIAGGLLYADSGGSTQTAPAFIRVSKIIQASQLLVTQSNAPIVTSLPVGNLVTGQEVDLYVTSPYVGYQRYKWNGTAWYVIGDSRAQGVWQSFTPTLTQSSNVTFTINYAKYVVFGKTVMVNFNLSATSSGVLNNNILLGFGSGSTALPTAASASGIHGNFRWFDAGVSNWVGTICGSNTTSVFFTNDGNGNNAGFSGTLTSGDVIEGSFFYEMA